MHYIRLLRSPTIEHSRINQWLKVVLTITTDLNDSFLAPQEPIELVIIGAINDPKGGPPTPINLTPARAPKWTAGMRALKLDLPLARGLVINTVLIRPAHRPLAALGTADIYPGDRAVILPVYADAIDTLADDEDEDKLHVCFRSLRLPGGEGPNFSTLQVEEEMGESMARHIWDGGLTTAALIADLCLGPARESSAKLLPMLRNLLLQDQRLNVLELGCGVGILGTGIARILDASSSEKTGTAHVLMTDVPDAEERVRSNIVRFTNQTANATDAEETSVGLDYENLDWDDGKNSTFGPKVQSRPWDLVALSDCTYNDLLPILVQTISAIHTHSAQHASNTESGCDTKLLLATKQRHSSERAVFDLLSADGWHLCEEASVPLPVLTGSTQSVEVYLFSKK
ncbi:putative methyltransferase-domain-containing protein [Bombardia bombarda]|uniref:Methyltransferase-domain-containing protein n=1 Tax=Bombardia bombarda TaxID=252184 RepID=A0AA39WHS7_9PEZI|nr:putative methyltransferase-domain-containing protein [Bombardia bombarda]